MHILQLLSHSAQQRFDHDARQHNVHYICLYHLPARVNALKTSRLLLVRLRATASARRNINVGTLKQRTKCPSAAVCRASMASGSNPKSLLKF
jgi:hypothetical protein